MVAMLPEKIFSLLGREVIEYVPKGGGERERERE